MSLSRLSSFAPFLSFPFLSFPFLFVRSFVRSFVYGWLVSCLFTCAPVLSCVLVRLSILLYLLSALFYLAYCSFDLLTCLHVWLVTHLSACSLARSLTDLLSHLFTSLLAYSIP